MFISIDNKLAKSWFKSNEPSDNWILFNSFIVVEVNSIFLIFSNPGKGLEISISPVKLILVFSVWPLS